MGEIYKGSDLEQFLPPKNLKEAVDQLKSRTVNKAELFTAAGKGHAQRIDFTPPGRVLFLAKAKEAGLTPVQASRQAYFEWINK